MTERASADFCLKKLLLILLLCSLSAIFYQSTNAQNAVVNTPFNSSRFKSVIITESAVTTIGLIGLNYLWYKKFPHSRFHFFNDSNEWLNMDKAGHATTAYSISAMQYNMMRWSGVKNNQAIWIGGLTALGMQTIIEIFDGFSQKWGFSTTDMLANILGTSLFMYQQAAFNDQRVQLKFSFHKTIFANYNPNELGKNKWQRWLKDYNGQTYWLSVNPASFMKSPNIFPRWLNASFGYGADGMIGAVKNPVEIGNKLIPNFKRYRQYYFSLDADLKHLDGDRQSPKALLSILQIIKVPFPAIEYNSKMPVKFHWLYF